MKKFPGLIIIAVVIIAVITLIKSKTDSIIISPDTSQNLASSYSKFLNTTINPSISATPTPKPLTFTEMNLLYGPCVYLPTLYYHHVQNLDEAKRQGHLGLTVSPEKFDEQMSYLASRGYLTVTLQDLINFFDKGIPIARKSILITFDDGYNDFALNTAPTLNKYNYKAVMFLITGLVNNPNYLSWDQVSSLASNPNYYFANHTWSHKSLAISNSVTVDSEILTADRQLSEKNLNSSKVFAYPYGAISEYAQNLLAKNGYNLAFGTRPGSTMCKKQRFVLPRVRVGNVSIADLGF